jgi:phytoene dehydrogenase-like protein
MARQAMLKTMDKCGLSINATDVEFEREQSPATFYERDGNYRGSLYGPVEKHRLFGMMPQRNYDEEYRNLYYCGGSVQPGAGLPMVMLSGKFAVERLAKR